MLKPRLLLVSATYIAEENRKKIVALAEHFTVICVTGTQVKSMGQMLETKSTVGLSGYRLLALPTLGDPSTTTKYLLRGLGEIFRTNPADLVLVEAEPWALVRWQVWFWRRWHQPKALFGEFSWENVRRRGWKGAILERVYRAAAATADFVVAGNRAAGALFEQGGLSPRRLLVAPQLGVDETLFAPLSPSSKSALRIQRGLPAEGFSVGFSGRFVEQKGLRQLVTAVETARAKSGQDIQLSLLGMGPLLGEIESTAETRPWLRVFPPCSHAEVAGFMQILDLFVLFSQPWREGGEVWEEQFGHVLVEAMACGVACIGSDSGEIPNVLGAPEAVVPAEGMAALASKIEDLARHPQQWGALAEFQHRRTLELFTNRALGQRWGKFLLGRLSAERRSILWADPNLIWESPSTRHLLHLLPRLEAEGWEVRAWCYALAPEAEAAGVEVRRFSPPRLSALALLWYFVRVNLARWGYQLLRGRRPAAVVHTMGGFYLGAELVSIHFVNALWIRRQMELGFDGWKDLVRWLFSLTGWAMDTLQFRHPESRCFLAVSDSIADEVRRRVPPGRDVRTFPNSYDEERFHPGVRAEFREAMRVQLGYAPEQVVFIFVSQGHYRRKGFWLAVEALERVRRSGRKEVRLLVVGGAPEALADLKKKLETLASDGAQWVLFVGPQPQVERYYAAADAFLFPSYFETYSLVTMEAAATGLPLLLTPFHGSEMTLVVGVNGILISYDVTHASTQIEGFLKNQNQNLKPGPGRGLNRREYAEALLAIYNRWVEERSS